MQTWAVALWLNRLACLQVSHHPPVGAAHAENKDWEYDMVSAPATKFLGNSIDIYPIGTFVNGGPCGMNAFSITSNTTHSPVLECMQKQTADASLHHSLHKLLEACGRDCCIVTVLSVPSLWQSLCVVNTKVQCCMSWSNLAGKGSTGRLFTAHSRLQDWHDPTCMLSVITDFPKNLNAKPQLHHAHLLEHAFI